MGDPNKRFLIALSFAFSMYLIGVAGILSPAHQFFANGTPLIIMAMSVLILFTQRRPDKNFFLFAAVCFAVGILSEIIFISNPYLFGSYQFGKSLGPLIKQVPWVIGLNWFLIIYSVGIFTHRMYALVEKKLPPDNLLPKNVQRFSIVVDGAFVAVFLEWLMEPVAIKMGYWTWENDEIPVSNYVTWYIVSALLLLFFELLPFNKNNRFAIHLFILQILFFLTLRTFL